MINSSPTFIALVLLINAHLSVARETTASGDQQSENNDQVEKINWDDIRLPKPEYHSFSLSCLLFKDVGCDVECFLLTHFFRTMGGGVCDTNNVCSCSYALDPSFNSSWKKKFSSAKKLRNEIITDKKLFHEVKKIINTPFRTGSEIKEKLKERLSPDQYNQLKVIGFASSMNTAPNKVDRTEVEQYVNEILSSEVMNPSCIELSNTIDVKDALIKALKRLRCDNEKFTLFISEIRKLENTFMNEILGNFINKNHIPLNEDTTNQISNVADTISKSIINKLVTMTTKPEKNSLQSCINWVGEKFTYVFTLGFLPSNPVDIDTILKNRKFFILPGLNVKRFEGSAPIDSTFSGDKFKLRYRRDENSNNINLTWIKKPVVVSILKTGESNVSQNWIFGTVRIYLTRTNDGFKSEIWNFDKVTYEYYKIIDSNGETQSKEEWSEDNNGKILRKHQSYITSWCRNNYYLISNNYCVIFNYLIKTSH